MEYDTYHTKNNKKSVMKYQINSNQYVNNYINSSIDSFSFQFKFK